MPLNSEQVGWLLNMLRNTNDAELSCPECADQLDKYAQRILDDEPLDEVLVLVKEHLAACSGCNDEFLLILETIRAMEDES